MSTYYSAKTGKHIEHNYKTRSLGGSLMVIRNHMEWVTIERGANSVPKVVEIRGDWDSDQLNIAMTYWQGSDAQKR
jgi:hypothetical protein